MDNSQQKHDKWMSEYQSRNGSSFEGYQEIINDNNLVLEKINNGDTLIKNRFYDKAIEVLSEGIAKGEQLLSEDNLIDESNLAKAYINRGVAYEYLGNGEKAIHDKRKSVEMLEKLCNDGNLEDKYALALAYMNRGVTYDAMDNYEMAIADGEKSIKILEQLKQEGRDVSSDYDMVSSNISNAKTKHEICKKTQSPSSYKEEDLTMTEDRDDKATSASIYADKGMRCFLHQEYIESVSNFDKAIEMMEDIRVDGGQLDRNELAKAYAGRGMARYGTKELELSIPDLNRGIKIWECLKEEGKFVDGNMLSMAYSIIDALLNTTNAISDDDNEDETLSSLEVAENRKTDKQMDENNLALAHMRKGISFDLKEEYHEANRHYDKAIKIWEQLDKEGISIDNEKFAKAYMNRGANYYEIGKNAKALADYDKCISIIEELLKDGVEQDTFDMVMAYKNRGRAYEIDDNLKAAIDDNLTALRIIKNVFSNEPELQEEYYGTLIEIMELLVKSNDRELYNNVIADFLYSMCSVPKTAEAEELQNSILEQLE